MNKRIMWADQSKGFEVLLIFTVHFFPSDVARTTLPMQLMTLSVLSAFYFTSGYFFKGCFEWKQWLKHNAYTLLLPYLVASSVFWVIHFVQGDPGSFDRFLGIFLQLPNTPWEGGRWFVPSFFVAKLVFDFTASRYKENIPVLFALCAGYAAVAWVYTLLGGPRLPWNIEAALFAQPFFAMGYAWKQGMEQQYMALSTPKKTAIIFAAAVGYIGLAWLNLKIGGRTVDYHSRLLNEFFTAYGASACSLFLILQISMRRSRLLSFLGRNSVVYYMYSGFSTAITNRLAVVLGLNHWFAQYLIYMVGLILLLTLMAMVMERYFPWTMGRKKAQLKQRTMHM